MTKASPSSPPSHLRRNVMLAVGLSISAIFCALVLRQIDLATFLEATSRASPAWLALSVLASTLGFVFMAMRSRLLFRPHRDFRFWVLLKSVLLAFAANNVFPFRLGDIIRVGYVARHGELPYEACLSTIGLERVLDLCLMLTIFGVLLPVFAPELVTSPTLIAGVGVLIVALGVMALAGLHPARIARWFEAQIARVHEGLAARLAQHVESFLEGLSGFSSPRAALTAIFWTACYWSTALIISSCWFQAFDLALPWYAPLVFVAFISLGTLIPSSPAFVGTYHFFAAHALTTFGVDAGVAASFAIVVHAVNFAPMTLATIALFSGEFFKLVRQSRDASPQTEPQDTAP